MAPSASWGILGRDPHPLRDLGDVTRILLRDQANRDRRHVRDRRFAWWRLVGQDGSLQVRQGDACAVRIEHRPKRRRDHAERRPAPIEV